jgi:hypothetical protein
VKGKSPITSTTPKITTTEIDLKFDIQLDIKEMLYHYVPHFKIDSFHMRLNFTPVKNSTDLINDFIKGTFELTTTPNQCSKQSINQNKIKIFLVLVISFIKYLQISIKYAVNV